MGQVIFFAISDDVRHCHVDASAVVEAMIFMLINYSHNVSTVMATFTANCSLVYLYSFLQKKL